MMVPVENQFFYQRSPPLALLHIHTAHTVIIIEREWGWEEENASSQIGW
jgi:hypothetical protein